MPVLDLLSVDNPVFRNYVVWSGVLLLKTLAMSILTGSKRFRTKTFANPEDALSKKAKVAFGNEEIERVRRAHRNDLENVFPLIIAGFFYVFINPTAFLAINLYRAAVLARIAHTVVYAIVVIPQPARALAFFVPFGITAYMSVQTILYFL